MTHGETHWAADLRPSGRNRRSAAVQIRLDAFPPNHNGVTVGLTMGRSHRGGTIITGGRIIGFTVEWRATKTSGRSKTGGRVLTKHQQKPMNCKRQVRGSTQWFPHRKVTAETETCRADLLLADQKERYENDVEFLKHHEEKDRARRTQCRHNLKGAPVGGLCEHRNSSGGHIRLLAEKQQA